MGIRHSQSLFAMAVKPAVLLILVFALAAVATIMAFILVPRDSIDSAGFNSLINGISILALALSLAIYFRFGWQIAKSPTTWDYSLVATVSATAAAMANVVVNVLNALAFLAIAYVLAWKDALSAPVVVDASTIGLQLAVQVMAGVLFWCVAGAAISVVGAWLSSATQQRAGQYKGAG